MARVITFSTKFPSYHPRKGEATYFPEKILKSISVKNYWDRFFDTNGSFDYTNYFATNFNYLEFGIKLHTIRAGNRWRVGDRFSPRIWSGKPYCSKQIIISPDIEIKNIFSFEMRPSLWFDECSYFINSKEINARQLIEVSKNDGLNVVDFMSWFAGKDAASSKRKPFSGQIICWNKDLKYNNNQ